MATTKDKSSLVTQVHDFVLRGFTPRFDSLSSFFDSQPEWRHIRETGTELWLDTGDITEIDKLWTREFSALTVNNTLLNKVIQTGVYDGLIDEIYDLLSSFEGLSDEEKMLEANFILNAWHGLRLVEHFDAYVSLEEHTLLASNMQLAYEYAKRFYAVCPQRFYIKIPFTPEGLLATRKLSLEKIPVNHTLGFSARQNYLIARIGKPEYVNVFLGRLNNFVSDNNLGDGSYIGEAATLSSQRAIKMLRDSKHCHTRQIAASIRSGEQVRDLAGVDVMTIPTKAAAQFLDIHLQSDEIIDKTSWSYTPGVYSNIDTHKTGIDTLWDIDDKFITVVEKLESQDLHIITADDLVSFFEEDDLPDVLVKWTDDHRKISTQEGKIPKFENWKDMLNKGEIGVDSLMNLAGLCSFADDQKKMDDRIKGRWSKL